MRKNIKIPEELHRELKIVSAKSKEKLTITELVVYALIADLKNRGHKFSMGNIIKSIN